MPTKGIPTVSDFQLTNSKETHYKILVELQANPLAPAMQIADKLDISPTTVISVLNNFRQNNTFTDVNPDFNVDALDLKIVDVLAKPTTFESLLHLESRKDNGELCYFPHPYILYHARIYGSYDGLFYQFRIPKGTDSQLYDFFQQLKAADLLSEFQFLERDAKIRSYTRANLSEWDVKEFRWNFDGAQWLHNFTQGEQPYTNPVETTSILSELDQIDMLFLSELSIDARRKNNEISKAVIDQIRKKGLMPSAWEISSQDCSRRLKKLRENAIERFRLFLNWKTFDIYNTAIFFCQTKAQITRQIAAYLTKEPIPFESVFVGLKTGFFWYIRAPSNSLSYFAEFLSRMTEKKELSLLDYRSSTLYNFDPETYDQNTRWWKKEKEFMVDAPLKELKAPFK